MGELAVYAGLFAVATTILPMQSEAALAGLFADGILSRGAAGPGGQRRKRSWFRSQLADWARRRTVPDPKLVSRHS
ncbi:hypothetical protein BQ8794_140258 [Mesorhizobium prunaredense]|uniref:Uncharacterized protein n=1 Tax=Mesorhizobium prunaredense TaxID=1631249 RepID=A0A1R3V2H3_9HYPH|nr:hypothetical protein BQ8794_140258 [Mesorhizobium prunaredense]